MADKYVQKSQYKKNDDDMDLVFGPVFTEDGKALLDEADQMTRERDPAIYNDHDFYKNLLSDLLNANGMIEDAQ